MDTQLIASPGAGKDPPSNWNDFLDGFSSEEAGCSLNEGRSPHHAYQNRNALTSAATAAAIAMCVTNVGCRPSWVVPGFIATAPLLQ